MIALVIVAGRGTRLSPLSDTKPKSMIPIGGKPALEHLLLTLKDSGIDDVILVVGYLGDMIKSRFGDGSSLGMNLRYIYQERPLGTGDAVATAKSQIGEDNFLVVYGDLLFSSEIISPLLTSEYTNRNLMFVVKVDDARDYGVINLNQNRVEEIIEKPTDEMEGSQWINAGIYSMNKTIFECLDRISNSPRGELELTDAINLLIKSGQDVSAIRIDSKDWMEIGKPWDLLEANERVLKGLDEQIEGDVEKGAHLAGPIFLGRRARIRSGAYIEGPVFIGEGCDIGPNCFIRPYTSLGSEVRIGHACEIKNSLIMTRTNIGHLSYVGDSILGGDCNLGAGTITANLRFDDENVKVRVKQRSLDSGRRKLGVIMGDRVKTGIDVSIMPGVKIGHDSWIGPNVTLTRDVEPYTFVSKRAQYETSKIE